MTDHSPRKTPDLGAQDAVPSKNIPASASRRAFLGYGAALGAAGAGILALPQSTSHAVPPRGRARALATAPA
jgi:hypothetical protein